VILKFKEGDTQSNHCALKSFKETLTLNGRFFILFFFIERKKGIALCSVPNIE
jgi:hypothetical protein